VVAGAESVVGTRAAQQAQPAPLSAEWKFNVGDRGAQIVEHAKALGREYEKKYRNCAQCTVAALQGAIEFVPKSGDAFLAATCLAGGATKTGEANCGGFTGAGIVIGLLCGRPRDRFGDPQGGALAGKVFTEVAARYERVLCRVVKEKAGNDCVEVVARAAGWAAEAILKQFSDYGGQAGLGLR
jgi:hypothetical protein